MEFFIVDDSVILTRYHKAVAIAKHGIIMGEYKNITQACKEVGISRLTYYKYCAHIYYIGMRREEDNGGESTN